MAAVLNELVFNGYEVKRVESMSAVAYSYNIFAEVAV